ncbi:MAG TPA: 7-cyano-7-deazaguanine synthase [Acidobacteriota bacterium]|nr:7-cyano-7-deazaguanine synthase [Acidobacteriota bacterium]
MKPHQKQFLFCCNGAPSRRRGAQILEYRPDKSNRNIVAGLPKFVQNVIHLPARTLDLLEIATYVFAGDRHASRGRLDAVEYHTWSRMLEFHIRVRDPDFWNRSDVHNALTDAIQFMSGDARVSFTFLPGHDTPPTSLFDRLDFRLEETGLPRAISLFSGGLDSLAGALDLLLSNKHALLISHESQTGTMRTQRALYDALAHRFPAQVSHYKFEAHLTGKRAPEETQRTRAFLYCSIAFALADACTLNEIFVHENGVTSINLYRREDLANARASRTTHPRSMLLLGKLFSLMQDRPFAIRLPFLNLTKRDIIDRIRSSPLPDLLSSAVSCTRAFQRGSTTHCGTCFQCIDRRIAAFAAGASDADHPGLYESDLVTSALDDPVSRTTAVDYLRQAVHFEKWGSSRFEEEYASELALLADAMPGFSSDVELVAGVWRLMKRHGEDVAAGIRAMRELHDDPFAPLPERSLLALVACREYLKPEVMRLVESIGRVLGAAIPEMFRTQRPADEPDLNAKIGALMRSHEPKLRSEHPTVSFACARVVPDHLLPGGDLLIESKYIRTGTTPAKASEGIAGDLTKYPQNAHILFLVYDPDHAIQSDEVFTTDFESRGRCTVKVLR